MTDTEITLACAKAMNLAIRKVNLDGVWITPSNDHRAALCYDPLHDKEQALELMEHLLIDLNYSWGLHVWTAHNTKIGSERAYAQHADLSRAIVMCVAQGQQ